LAATAVSQIRSRLAEVATEPWIPTRVVANGIQQIAVRDRGAPDPIDLSHVSHTRWLLSLTEARLDAESENFAAALHRASRHLESLPVANPATIGAITEVRALGAETHNGGQHPLLIRFSEHQAVVYKPVSLEIDKLISEILAGLSRHSRAEALFTTLQYAPLGPDYGFVALAPESRPLSEEAAAERFFFRFGALIAVAYALNITDMHMENVLAIGEHPVLIDLETALYRFPDSIRPTDVTATGLVESGRGSSRPNSGLQGGGPCRKWALDLQSEGRRTVVGYRRPHFHAANRASDSSGALLEPSHFHASVLAGFDAGYTLLSEKQDGIRRLVEERAMAKPIRIRHIHRFTSYYVVHLFKLLQPSASPMSTREEKLREKLLRDPTAVDCPSTELVDGEIKDLLAGDVPYFWSQPGSRDLMDCRGLVHPGFFDSSSVEALHQQLDRLSAADQREQRGVLEGAIRPGLDQA
jgi:Domain of unknown function (DUF4135)